MKRLNNYIKNVVGAALLLPIVLAAGCGGGSSNSPVSAPAPPPAAPPPPPVVTLDPQYHVSAVSPLAANCDGATAAGTVYVNAEVEPSLAINPANTLSMAAVWQEDRWSTGGARGIVAGTSSDGGKTWSQHAMPFTRCGGGTAANAGDYDRASNPWITAAPDGTLNQLALAFDGGLLSTGSVSAVLAARSTDGGVSWGPTQTLIRDTNAFFNDKGAITADPVNPGFVYAVWDRLTGDNFGPAQFTRSINGGLSWETSRAIYDPGVGNQTISNAIVVLPNGALVDMFEEIDGAANNTFTAKIQIIRSTDGGTHWSAPIKVADSLGIGTHDPNSSALVRDATLVPEIATGPGGTLAVVWQDARFSSGAHDDIAIARSTDGGITWTAPARVNATNGPAFSPNVNVRADGTIGVAYFDFRPNTADSSTLFTAYWLERSSDGITWKENQLAGPFDLALAPLTTSPAPGGYFLGDYQALLSVGNLFVPMFVQTNAGSPTNRTDVFIAPAVSAITSVGVAASTATVVSASTASAEMQHQVSDNIVRAMRARIPAWQSGQLREE